MWGSQFELLSRLIDQLRAGCDLKKVHRDGKRTTESKALLLAMRPPERTKKVPARFAGVNVIPGLLYCGIGQGRKRKIRLFCSCLLTFAWFYGIISI